MARYGLTPAGMAQSVEALFQGTVAGEVVGSGLTSRVMVRFPERLRLHRDDVEALPVTTSRAEVILGGLLSSTFLNLVVVPVLFARWGADPGM
jgi:Cu/Ag efflux pump CusA